MESKEAIELKTKKSKKHLLEDVQAIEPSEQKIKSNYSETDGNLHHNYGHQLGNFPNYYAFHPPSERLGIFNDSFFHNLLINKSTNCFLFCDIGCNEGNLSISLMESLFEALKQLKKGNAEATQTNKNHELKQQNNAKIMILPDEVHLLGIDIDEMLINRAKSKYSDHQLAPNITFEAQDICQQDSATIRNFLSTFGQTSFNMMTCFSTTMWIHINHGDEGLRKFLITASRLTEVLVLEPQPWKCYRNARQRLRRLKLPPAPYLDTLEMKFNVPELMKDILLGPECGFSSVEILGKTKWSREIWLFKK